MNINNLHENVTKLKNDTEIIKFKLFSYENISRNKGMFKSTTGLEADNFQAVFEFLDKVPHCENVKFYDGQNNENLKVILKMLNLEKRQAPSTRSIFYVLKFLCTFMYVLCTYLRNGFTTRMLS